MSKKIGIITFHRATNYGAILQCYAMIRALKKLGLDCEVIDYATEEFLRENLILRKTIKEKIKYCLLRRIIEKRNTGFNSFLKEIPLSNDMYSSLLEIVKIQGSYSMYIVGSDQVWNYRNSKLDPVYFLQFDKTKGASKCAYACSFGNSTFPKDKVDECSGYLKMFDNISVREPSGKQYIKQLIQRDVDVCIDPTFLLKANEWQDCVIHLEQGTRDEDYILIYYVGKPFLLQEYAKRIATKYSLPVIVIPGNHSFLALSGINDWKYRFTIKSDCSPYEFIRLIYNARYVLTNSFHGTAFSIIFHKQFLTMVKQIDGKQNNRVYELLKELDLDNRTVENGKIEDYIEWDNVDSKLDCLRDSSIRYLERITYGIR